MLKLLSKSAIAAVFLASAGGSAVAEQGDQSCPVSWTQLRWAMTSAARPTKQHFWGVVVNRSGTVCAVAFSGSMATDQWLLSRQIAAAKAFTSNGLSLDNSVGGGQQWATAMLDGAVQTTQDNGGLYGLHFGNLQDADDALKGPSTYWGTAQDPMVNRRVGGTISFGGGVPLVTKAGNVQGALGVSGDTACNDDTYSRAVRTILAGGVLNFGNDNAGSCHGPHPGP